MLADCAEISQQVTRLPIVNVDWGGLPGVALGWVSACNNAGVMAAGVRLSCTFDGTATTRRAKRVWDSSLELRFAWRQRILLAFTGAPW